MLLPIIRFQLPCPNLGKNYSNPHTDVPAAGTHTGSVQAGRMHPCSLEPVPHPEREPTPRQAPGCVSNFKRILACSLKAMFEP
jgi:hypothetical protein